MGVRYLSYLDVPPARRAAAGAAVTSDLQRALSLPGMAPEQQQQIRAQIDRVSSWIDGTLEHSAPEVPHAEVVLPAPPEPVIEEEPVTPRQHVVVVTEEIDLDDDYISLEDAPEESPDDDP